MVFKQDGSSETPAYKVSISDGQLTSDFSSARIKFIPAVTMTPPKPTGTDIIVGSVVGSVVGVAAITAAIGLFVHARKEKKWCFKPTHPDDVEIPELSRPRP